MPQYLLANLPGPPVIAVSDALQHMTQFVIPTQRWSDANGISSGIADSWTSVACLPDDD